MTANKDDTGREPFEAYFRSMEYDVSRLPSGSYKTESARFAWSVWKKSRATISVDLPAKNYDFEPDEAFYRSLDVEDALQDAGIQVKL